MAHLVETLAYNHVRGVPWHRLGNKFVGGEVTTWDEMRVAAGLLWEIESTPVYGPDGTEIPGWQNIRRDDTKATLNLARKSYTPISHADMGEILTALTETTAKNGTKLEFDTAASLDEGRKVFATIAVGEPYNIDGDASPIQRFVALLNAHDGTAACRAIYTDVRIVCANTWHLADTMGGIDEREYTFRHTANWRTRLSEAADAIQGITRDAFDLRERMNHLVTRPFTDEQYTILAERFIPTPPENQVSEQVMKNVILNRRQFAHIARPNNPTTLGIRNTLYGAAQVVGEYLDHVRTWRSPESYVNRTLLSANRGKANGLRLAEEIVAAGDGRKTIVAVSN